MTTRKGDAKDRLAAALRENLKRRKARQRTLAQGGTKQDKQMPEGGQKGDMTGPNAAPKRR